MARAASSRCACLVLILALAATACGDSQEQLSARASPTPTPSPSPTPEPEPTPCPLTGSPASEDVDLDRPVLAVKIDNAPPARPQAGLQAADVVYEELVEGGITRFLALFHCRDAERVGPVRSARMVDPQLLQQYAPVLFAYSGANDTVLERVAASRGLIDLQHGKLGSAYSRASGRSAPHDLFTSTEAIRAAEDARGVEGSARSGFVFDEELVEEVGSGVEGAGWSVTPSAPRSPQATPSAGASPEVASSGEGRAVSFSYAGGGVEVSYTYDAASGAYRRSLGGNPHNGADGEPLSAVNVLVFKVEVTPGLVISAAGARSPEIEVTGEGEAVILRAGQAVRGRWRRSTPAGQFEVVDSGGEPVRLAPGNVWINLLPSDRPVTVE